MHDQIYYDIFCLQKGLAEIYSELLHHKPIHTTQDFQTNIFNALVLYIETQEFKATL